MKPKVSWNDYHEASPTDLKRVYKLSDRQLEQNIRYHMDGTTPAERRSEYEQLYRRNRNHLK